MSPITHFLASWLVANTVKTDSRDRALITIAGIIPDADGILIIADLTRNSGWYEEFHHIITHNIGFAFLITICSFVFARKRLITAFLAFIAFHIHLLGDIAGSRGPDGYQWPINYLWPFSNFLQLRWAGQWELNAWQNLLITTIAIFLTIFLAWKRGYSLIEIFSRKADRYFVCTLRKWFGSTSSG
jgi:membrane-bound metal-dependent hydrolase YbcI (DUF457 family)